MIVAFISKTEFLSGIDCSDNPALIFQKEIESFNPKIHTALLVGLEGDYDIVISDKFEGESIQDKRNRKLADFISTEDINDFDWEGIELSLDDYNNLIILRNFGGDKGAQIATSFKKDIKDLYVMVKILGVPLDVIHEIYADDIAITEKVIESRKALGLSIPDISFLYHDNNQNNLESNNNSDNS